jgi:transcriptional regulator with GAF, ATPase, and Fis domain
VSSPPYDRMAARLAGAALLGPPWPAMVSRRLDETVSTDRSHQPSATPRTVRLAVVHPRGLAGVHSLPEASVTLGRQDGAGALALVHPTVSRQHTTLRWDPVAGRHAAVDLGSRNGTWLDGQAVSSLPRYLEDGAVLRLGDVLAVYERREGETVDAPQVSRRELPGDALAAVALRAAIARAGVDPSPVLVLGETGVGKERIAAELHRLSGRSGPLVTINCSAISAQLVESQLFGHVRGAFTGATGDHVGLFRAASGGTLFLDELGELPLDLQPKLLRAVELGEVMAVGSTQRHKVDVRLVAATNRSLQDDIQRGRFRRDLYARLALWELHAPPLRERRPDLLAWIDRLHRAWSDQRGQPEPRPIELAAVTAERLLLDPWPDNLRGLQRCVHELAAAVGGAPIGLAGLPAWLRAGPPAPERPRPAAPDERAPRPLRERPTREALLEALAANGWSVRATARHYERDRKQINRWVEMYAIDLPERDEDS